MAAPTFDYCSTFASHVPQPATRFAGLPRYNFVGGHNDPLGIPAERLAEAASTVLRREGQSLALYNLGNGPQGYPPLRQFVADKLRQHRGTMIEPSDVFITSGSSQGLDLVNRLLVNPGDTVIMEEFSYTGAIKRALRAGAKVAGAPLAKGGIDVGKLESMLAEMRAEGVTPKYLYTIPTIQNPTGSIMPLEHRRALLELAERYGVLVFEDECYADLGFGGDAPPSLYALAPGQVIHIGSFSKNLSPAARLGYVVAHWDVLSRMIPMKTDGGSGAINQMVVAEYFSQHYDDHLKELKLRLAEKLQATVTALDREFGTAVEYVRPEGGIFIWLKLPDSVDTTLLVAPAAAEGIAFNPGPEWAVDGSRSRSYMRLCYALPSVEDIDEGIAKLARICFEQTGVPVRSNNVQK